MRIEKNVLGVFEKVGSHFFIPDIFQKLVKPSDKAGTIIPQNKTAKNRHQIIKLESVKWANIKRSETNLFFNVCCMTFIFFRAASPVKMTSVSRESDLLMNFNIRGKTAESLEVENWRAQILFFLNFYNRKINVCSIKGRKSVDNLELVSNKNRDKTYRKIIADIQEVFWLKFAVKRQRRRLIS